MKVTFSTLITLILCVMVITTVAILIFNPSLKNSFIDQFNTYLSVFLLGWSIRGYFE